MKMKRIRAEDVAEYFIHLSKTDKRKRGISNKKLQKLVYYAQAWSLVLTNNPLFHEPFEAWIHGPAIPALYRKFKQFGFKPVESQNPKFDPDGFPHKDILDEVWRVYGKYDADYLEILTHQEEPWIRAREALEFEESSNKEISTEIMKNFYMQKLKDTSIKNVEKE
jgi:uncharacterized phage-associated protein